MIVKHKTLAVTLSLLLLSGCIALPIPHEKYDHSTVKGQIIDVQTGLPVTDVTLQLNGDVITPDEQGNFIFTPNIQKSSWTIYPLLPFDSIFYCYDTVKIDDNVTNGGYRGLEIGVRSCIGRHASQKNLSIVDDLGTIEMRPLPSW